MSEANARNAADEKFLLSRQIEQDIEAEFGKLRQQFQDRLSGDFDLDQTKAFIADDCPRAVLSLNSDLLDTLLNYLMKDCRNLLQSAPVDTQNKFYDLNLREKIKETYTVDLQKPDLSYPDLTSLYKVARIAVPPIGATALLFPWSVGWRITAGIIFAVVSAAFFQDKYKRSVVKSRDTLKREVTSYIDQCSKESKEWLAKQVRDGFIDNFVQFCGENGFYF